MGFLDDIGNLLGGTNEQAAQAKQQGFGSVLAKAPSNFGGAVNLATSFGSVGDVSGGISQLTGTDPVSGMSQSKESRGLGFATLFGFGGAASAMGVLAGTGKMARRLREAEEFAQNLRADAIRTGQDFGVQQMFNPQGTPKIGDDIFGAAPVAVGDQVAGMQQYGTQMFPVQATISELAAANQPVSIWGSHAANGMIRYADTHAFLQASPDPVTGYARHARTLVRGTDDPVALNAADGFIRALAPRLAETTHYKALGVATLTGAAADRAHLTIAGFELSRFNAAIEKDILASTQKDKLGRATKVAFEKLRNGEMLQEKEIELLSDAMVKFADSVWFLDSPELTGTPLASISKVNIEGDEALLSVQLKQFDAASIDQLTWKEINSRMGALYQGDPTAMVPVHTSMITKFVKDHMDVHTMEYFADWYPQARVATSAAAARVGMDAERFIVLTAIMSPGQPWDANVPKAEAFVQALKDYNAGKFKSPLQGDIPPKIAKAMQREMKEAGIKLGKNQIDDGSEITRLWAAMARGDYSGGTGQMIPLASAIQAVLISKADDPWSIFTKGETRAKATKGGLPAGLKVNEMKKLYEAGTHTPDQLFAMRKNNPDQQLKVPSFTHAIARSEEEDLMDQARYMARMIHGGETFSKDLTDAEVMKSLRGELPVVVDRQAFKIAMGMSVLPDSFLSSQKDVFDVIAQAYRNAALELGVVPALGRHMLPEELQAATWVKYRMMGNVKFDSSEIPQGFNIPAGMNSSLNRSRGVRRFQAGQTRPMPNTVMAGVTEGAGPDLIWDHTVWDLITGNADRLPWNGIDGIDAGTDFNAFRNPPSTWFDDPNPLTRSRSESSVRTIQVRLATDGTMKVLNKGTQPTIDGALSARYPLMGNFDVDGNQLQAMAQSEPAMVANTETLFDTLNESTVHVANPELSDYTGAALHPQRGPDTLSLTGNHWLVATMQSKDEQPNFGMSAMQQAHAELTAAGIKVEMVPTKPYRGVTKPPIKTPNVLDSGPNKGQLPPWDPNENTPAWDPVEARQAALFSFDTNDDLQAAHRWSEALGPDGVANYKRIFDEDVLDSRYYVDNDISAPPGSTAVIEHHFVDPDGKEFVNLNTAGDQFWSNSRKVYLPAEFATYVTPAKTMALQPGAPMHTIGPYATVPPLEGLEVRGITTPDAPQGASMGELSTRRDQAKRDLGNAQADLSRFNNALPRDAKGKLKKLTKEQKTQQDALKSAVSNANSNESSLKGAVTQADKAAWSGIETRSPFQLYEVRKKNADGKWGKWAKPKEFAVYLPIDGSMPQIVIGTDTIPGVDPTRVVRVRLGQEPEFVGQGDNKGQIKVDDGKEVWHDVTQMIPHVDDAGNADARLGRLAYELLRRVGFDGPMRATEWKRT